MIYLQSSCVNFSDGQEYVAIINNIELIKAPSHSKKEYKIPKCQVANSIFNLCTFSF